jgi:hypothetical protein
MPLNKSIVEDAAPEWFEVQLALTRGSFGGQGWGDAVEHWVSCAATAAAALLPPSASLASPELMPT